MQAMLFRDEVVNARATAAMGCIILARPVPIRIAANLAAMLLIVVISCICFGSYSRIVSANGKISNSKGSIRIVAPQFGQVARSYFNEGAVARKGDVLYEITSLRISQQQDIETRMQASIARQRHAIISEWDVQASRASDKRKDMKKRLESYARELVEIEQIGSVQRDRLQTARKIVEKHRSLLAQGYISELQWDQVLNDYKKEEIQQNLHEAQKYQLQREYSQLKSVLNDEDGRDQMIRATRDRELAQLEQQSIEQVAKSRIQVIAPVNGTITAKTIEEGSTVNQSQTISTILPAGAELIAHLFVPSRSIGSIAKGQSVKLQVHSFPHQSFGSLTGVVSSVESAPILESGKESAIVEDSIFRVEVKLSDVSVALLEKRSKGHQLKPGMAVRAMITIESLPLFTIFLNHLLR